MTIKNNIQIKSLRRINYLLRFDQDPVIDQQLIIIIIYNLFYYRKMFKNMLKTFIKEDPLDVSLQKNLLYDQKPFTLNKGGLMKIYRQQNQQKREEHFVKHLVSKLQKKKSIIVKLKILLYLLLISKQSDYDISDMLMSKKIKLFSQDSIKKKINHTFELVESNRQDYIHKFLVIPIYNYMIKLALNQQLYNICKKQQIPNDDIFRKGTRIRYIWVFKIYNLINLLIPIITPLIILLQKNIEDSLFVQILAIVIEDITIYTNFITKCLDQTLTYSNPMLMPYNECLQFFECLKEYNLLKERLDKFISVIKKFIKVDDIILFEIPEDVYKEIEVLAMRVQLISVSLRNNNPKQNQRLITQYNQKVEVYEHRLKTQGDDV